MGFMDATLDSDRKYDTAHIMQCCSQSHRFMQTTSNQISPCELPRITASLRSHFESNNVMRLMGSLLLKSPPAHFSPSLASLV